jgi:diguanylate cyclase (GGDEF)-like protein
LFVFLQNDVRVILNGMKSHHFLTIYKEKKEVLRARTILGTIIGVLVAFLVIEAVAVFSGDTTLIIIILIGGFSMSVPAILLLRGFLRLSSIFLYLNVVIIMTVSSIFGQGIHDIAMITYPVAIFFASLVLQRRDFFWLSLLAIGAIGYLGFGEAFGWYVSKAHNDLVGVDFIIAIVILIFTIYIADALAENVRRNMQIAEKEIALRKKAQKQLRYLNTHDKLTGIYNRAFFDEILELMERRREYPVSFIFADMDNLKEANDKHGHAFGDQLLKQTSTIIGNAFRAGDISARIGGDEFAVLLPGTDAPTVKKLLSRLQKLLAQHNMKNPDRIIQVSFGTSTAENNGLKEALERADRDMYANKEIRKRQKK